MEPELAEFVAVRGGRWAHNGPLTGTTFIVQTTVVFDYLHKPPFIQTVSQRPIGKTLPPIKVQLRRGPPTTASDGIISTSGT